MYEEIFDENYFDDSDIIEEDVGIFDENYFEAMEGNNENKLKKKAYHYNQAITKYPQSVDTPPNIRYADAMKKYRASHSGDIRTKQRNRSDAESEVDRERELSNAGAIRGRKYQSDRIEAKNLAAGRAQKLAQSTKDIMAVNPKLAKSMDDKKLATQSVKNYHIYSNAKPTNKQTERYMKNHTNKVKIVSR